MTISADPGQKYYLFGETACCVGEPSGISIYATPQGVLDAMNYLLDSLIHDEALSKEVLEGVDRADPDSVIGALNKNLCVYYYAANEPVNP